MNAPAWVSLLRRIPANQHDSLILMTSIGAEIVLQRLIRLEIDYLVALGRLSGSNDQGKLLVIPYDQLTYLSYSKRVADTEIDAVLGLSPMAAPAAQTAAPTSAPAANPPMPAENPAVSPPAAETPVAAATPTPAPVNVPSKGSMPSKSILLARLRQRLAGDSNKPSLK